MFFTFFNAKPLLTVQLIFHVRDYGLAFRTEMRSIKKNWFTSSHFSKLSFGFYFHLFLFSLSWCAQILHGLFAIVLNWTHIPFRNWKSWKRAIIPRRFALVIVQIVHTTCRSFKLLTLSIHYINQFMFEHIKLCDEQNGERKRRCVCVCVCWIKTLDIKCQMKQNF